MRSSAPFAPFQHQPLLTSSQQIQQQPAAPPFIDPNPKLSAFTYKPTPQQQQQPQQTQQTQRRTNSGNDDKFTVRLSAMLDEPPSSNLLSTAASSASTSNLYPTRSFYASQPLIPRSATTVAAVTASSNTSATAQSDFMIAHHHFESATNRPLSAMDESSRSQQANSFHHRQKYLYNIYRNKNVKKRSYV